MKNLSIGTQELSIFKEKNYIYVDKTEIIHKLISSGRYYFLSRPRRFGKSLLVNTMEELFLGNKELFENTWIYKNWNFEDKYPVIKISFAKLDYEYLGLYKTIENTITIIANKNKIVLSNEGMKERKIC